MGTVQVRREGRTLRVAWELPNGLAEGIVMLNERFLRSGHGTYEHRLNDGRLAWGTWDLELDTRLASILVTTRYAQAVDQIEIVQGYEWRRTA